MEKAVGRQDLVCSSGDGGMAYGRTGFVLLEILQGDCLFLKEYNRPSKLKHQITHTTISIRGVTRNCTKFPLGAP